MVGRGVRLVVTLAMVVLAMAAKGQSAQQGGHADDGGADGPGCAGADQRQGGYVDIESLARITHASVRFQGGQTIPTLPGGASASTAAPAPAATPIKVPQQFSSGLSDCGDRGAHGAARVACGARQRDFRTTTWSRKGMGGSPAQVSGREASARDCCCYDGAGSEGAGTAAE